MEESQEVFSDAINRTVTWKSASDVSKLADQTVKRHFKMKDADLYSFQFIESK